ncbi:hypothetical protein AX774_g2601 [Zancudomyces culisetae]|uniref:Uncharacterized protein n=1 Tax=Zancudomyces culisetae TaxID=1213189 RepID=A0A1R1PSC1_ZANCU|nr:hypothetical protein AX774_g2601 [Zancudomyces culisetae]|eukprot:OMH83886.1 hypothetical protein AX774_g2601 [Zancudomyces culisetae]
MLQNNYKIAQIYLLENLDESFFVFSNACYEATERFEPKRKRRLKINMFEPGEFFESNQTVIELMSNHKHYFTEYIEGLKRRNYCRNKTARAMTVLANYILESKIEHNGKLKVDYSLLWTQVFELLGYPSHKRNDPFDVEVAPYNVFLEVIEKVEAKANENGEPSPFQKNLFARARTVIEKNASREALLENIDSVSEKGIEWLKALFISIKMNLCFVKKYFLEKYGISSLSFDVNDLEICNCTRNLLQFAVNNAVLAFKHAFPTHLSRDVYKEDTFNVCSLINLNAIQSCLLYRNINAFRNISFSEKCTCRSEKPIKLRDKDANVSYVGDSPIFSNLDYEIKGLTRLRKSMALINQHESHQFLNIQNAKKSFSSGTNALANNHGSENGKSKENIRSYEPYSNADDEHSGSSDNYSENEQIIFEVMEEIDKSEEEENNSRLDTESMEVEMESEIQTVTGKDSVKEVEEEKELEEYEEYEDSCYAHRVPEWKTNNTMDLINKENYIDMFSEKHNAILNLIGKGLLMLGDGVNIPFKPLDYILWDFLEFTVQFLSFGALIDIPIMINEEIKLHLNRVKDFLDLMDIIGCIGGKKYLKSSTTQINKMKSPWVKEKSSSARRSTLRKTVSSALSSSSTAGGRLKNTIKGSILRSKKSRSDIPEINYSSDRIGSEMQKPSVYAKPTEIFSMENGYLSARSSARTVRSVDGSFSDSFSQFEQPKDSGGMLSVNYAIRKKQSRPNISFLGDTKKSMLFSEPGLGSGMGYPQEKHILSKYSNAKEDVLVPSAIKTQDKHRRPRFYPNSPVRKSNLNKYLISSTSPKDLGIADGEFDDTGEEAGANTSISLSTKHHLQNLNTSIAGYLKRNLSFATRNSLQEKEHSRKKSKVFEGAPSVRLEVDDDDDGDDDYCNDYNVDDYDYGEVKLRVPGIAKNDKNQLEVARESSGFGSIALFKNSKFKHTGSSIKSSKLSRVSLSSRNNNLKSINEGGKFSKILLPSTDYNSSESKLGAENIENVGQERIRSFYGDVKPKMYIEMSETEFFDMVRAMKVVKEHFYMIGPNEDPEKYSDLLRVPEVEDNSRRSTLTQTDEDLRVNWRKSRDKFQGYTMSATDSGTQTKPEVEINRSEYDEKTLNTETSSSQEKVEETLGIFTDVPVSKVPYYVRKNTLMSEAQFNRINGIKTSTVKGGREGSRTESVKTKERSESCEKAKKNEHIETADSIKTKKSKRSQRSQSRESRESREMSDTNDRETTDEIEGTEEREEGEKFDDFETIIDVCDHRNTKYNKYKKDIRTKLSVFNKEISSYLQVKIAKEYFDTR